MQKALDSLLQIYLQKETLSGQIPTNKNGPTKFGIDNIPLEPQQEEDFVKALYECLEEKGVMKEVQAFLRQKLVNILKGVWPNLVSTKCEGNLGRTAMTLIEDFMCCHKLLFTYSVLATELDEGFTFKGDFGKMPFAQAAILLGDMGIEKGSKLNHTILASYSQNTNWSLLESIINSTFWPTITKDLSHDTYVPALERASALNLKENERNGILCIDDKMRQINEKYNEKTKKTKDASIGERLRVLTEAMEVDKENQIKVAIEKFKQEETAKIRDEIETRLKYEILQKEKVLLKKFENQVIHMKRSLKREKQLWANELNKKEKELSETRKELVKALSMQRTNDNMQNPVKLDVAQKLEPEVLENFEEIEMQMPHEPKRKTTQSQIKAREKISDTVNLALMKKDFERQFLLKEANFRSSIEKLRAENEMLQQSLHSDRIRNSPNIPHLLPPESLFEQAGQRKITETDIEQQSYADKIAFLQYQLESQSEEIEQLRRTNASIENKPSEQMKVVDSLPQRRPSVADDVDKFLEESKRRIAQIEREAKSVDLSLQSIQAKKENRGAIQILPGKAAILRQGPQIPKLPPPYRKSIFDADSKKYEYFPKYLNPDLQKPRPISSYQPILGSTPAHLHSGISTFSLDSHSNGGVQIESISNTPRIIPNSQTDKNNTSRTQAKESPYFYENEPKQIEYPAAKSQEREQISIASNRKINETSFDSKIELAVETNSSMPNLPTKTLQGQATTSKTQDDPLPIDSIPAQAPTKVRTILGIEVPQSFKQERQNSNSLVRLRKHQEKANTSGALVKDKLLTYDDKSDKSMSSTHSSIIEIHKHIEPPAPTWAQILNGSGSKDFLVKNPVESETIDDIGHIETGDADDEDFWTL